MHFFRFFALFCICLPMTVNATTPKEKQALERIVKELKFLQQEVEKTSQLRRVDDLEAFNYKALYQDMAEVREAIIRHLEEPSRQPRQLLPLTKNYERLH